MNIYLIRHAQSVGNKKRIFAGVTDFGLSDEGKESLDHVNEFFSDKDLASIYVSPLLRCRQTAEIIFGDREMISDDGLKEINFGEWEGVHVGEVMKNYPEKWEDYMGNWREFTFPGGDNIPDYQKRASSEVKRIVENHDDEDIAIVSHNGFIKAAISYMLTGNIELAFNLSVQNGKVNWIIVEEDFAKLRMLNY